MSVKKNGSKVILGLSGGVDSTAAALILKERGFEVTGLYFDVFGNNDKGRKKAEKVAQELSIKLIVKDVSQLFKETVIKNFIDEYTGGRTPNPCVLCNPTVKFYTLTEEADKTGAEYIATGHYAKVGYSDIQCCNVIKKAANEQKDQSYMLYRLPEKILNRLILPLSEFYDKEQTRILTRENNLSNAEDKDSQEICFLEADEDYTAYIQKNGTVPMTGNFIDKDGNVLGKHKGIMYYTIGQRKGLGIALGKPAFVVKINPKDNTVTLGSNEDLFTKEIICSNAFFTATSGADIPKGLENKKLFGKIRYAAKPASCSINAYDDNKVKIVFDEAQRAPTNGQSVVLYLEDEVVGGGIVDMPL